MHLIPALRSILRPLPVPNYPKKNALSKFVAKIGLLIPKIKQVRDDGLASKQNMTSNALKNQRRWRRPFKV
jgi:hypothetical protein